MKLFYRVQGKGQSIIIIHGIFGSSDNWLSITKKLSVNYQLYLIDLRNHGNSPQSDIFTYESMSDDLLELINDHAIKDPIIIGHSMGGKVAMHFSLHHPGKLKKLVVVDIAPKSYPVHHEKILEGLNAIPLSELKSRQEAESILANYVDEPDVRQFLLKNLSRNEQLQFQWKINLPIITKNIEKIGVEINKKKEFTKPTLFIKGGKSNYIKNEDSALIKKIFPQAEIKTIDQAGHWVQVDAPEDFLQLVEQFASS
jgi:pimeloyl-ACP methyl ester carboxylesterase